MLYRQTINDIDTIIERNSAILSTATEFANQCVTNANDGTNAHLAAPSNNEELRSINILAEQIRNNFDYVVVIGTGASTLIPQSLTRLGKHKTPIIEYVYHADDESFSRIMEHVEISKTAFVIISKSGGTLETLAHSLFAIDALKQVKTPHIGKHLFVVTENNQSPLLQLAHDHQATLLEHHHDIGGRFACFTNVGLLPAAISGVDIEKLCQGANDLLHQPSDPKKHHALAGALFLYDSIESEKLSNHIYMPYLERLEPFSMWARQMYAESLGKEGHGFTFIEAAGPIDQHSQLQLYLDGPNDKSFTLLRMASSHTSHTLDTHSIAKDLPAYLNNISLARLNWASCEGVNQTLESHNKQRRLIEFDQLEAYEIGALMMQVTLEILYLGHLWNITPYGQPAVEESKQTSRKLLQGS